MPPARGNGCPSGATVNRHLLPVKATYFFLFAAVAVLHPYFPVFLKDLGLTPAEAAIILTVAIAGSGIARTVIGSAADIFRNHTVVMATCCVLVAVFHIFLYFTPPVDRNDGPVTHDLAASQFCDDEGRVVICREPRFRFGNGSGPETRERVHLGGWNASHAEPPSTDCSVSCCLDADESSRSTDYQTQAVMRDAVSPYTESPYLSNQRTLQDPDVTSLELIAATVTSLGSRISNSNRCENPQKRIVVPWDNDTVDCVSFLFLDLNITADSAAELCARPRGELLCTLSCGEASDAPKDGQHTKQFGRTFLICFFIFFLIFFFSCPVFSVLDSLVYGLLRDKGSDFGKVRLWGTFALGVFGLLSGIVMDALARSGAGNMYLYPFVVCVTLCLVAAVLSYISPSVEATPSASTTLVPLAGANQASPKSGQTDQRFARNALRLVSNPVIGVVFFAVFTSGLILGVHDTFFFWFLKNLGAPQLVLGMCIVACCASEVVILFISGRIVALVSFRCCLYLYFLILGARLLVNSFIRNPWVAVATEAMQSVCNGLLFPAASLSINALAPPGMHGTIQGIIGALHWSIGKAVGSAIAGALYEAVGPRQMFRIFAGVSFSYAIFLVVTLETLHRTKCISKQTKEPINGFPDVEFKVDLKADDIHLKDVRADDKSPNDESSLPMLP